MRRHPACAPRASVRLSRACALDGVKRPGVPGRSGRSAASRPPPTTTGTFPLVVSDCICLISTVYIHYIQLTRATMQEEPRLLRGCDGCALGRGRGRGRARALIACDGFASLLEIVAKGPKSMTLFAIRTLRLTQNAIGTLVARGKRARARMCEIPTRQNANRRSIEAMGQCPYRQKCHGLGLFSCKEDVWRVRRGAQWGSTEKPTCGPVWRAARGSAHLTPASHATSCQPCRPAMPRHASPCIHRHASFAFIALPC